MKKFIIRCLLFGLIVCAILMGAYMMIPVNTNSYFYALKNKLEVLGSTQSPKIAFIGGSNVAFGVDCHAISDSFGIKTINTALHASLGIKFQIESAEPFLRKGDIVIIMPEYEQFYGSAWGGSELAPAIKSTSYNNLRLLSPAQMMAFISGVPQAAYDNFNKGIDSAYNSKNFNEIGDEVRHRYATRKKNIECYKLNKKLDLSAVKLVQHKIRELEDRGCKVILLPPATIQRNYETNIEKVLEVYLAFEKGGVPFAVKAESHVFPDSCAFDTPYHLANDGVEALTPRLVNEIRGALSGN